MEELRPSQTRLLWLARAGLPAVLVFGAVSGTLRWAAHTAGLSGWPVLLLWCIGLALGFLASRALLRRVWAHAWPESG